ncbi:MAG: molybdenum cofactor biosynthesis protein B [Candidatus Zixiibacteriota bacterium]
MKYSVAALIISDRADSGQRKDLCQPEFEAILSGSDLELAECAVTSDEPEQIRSALKHLIAREINLILTCGGTGCGVRDNTPEVTASLIKKLTPGIDEAIRSHSKKKTDYAIYSRGVSGVTGKSLIINLPGSPRSVSEILPYLLETIRHPLDLIAGRVFDCSDELAGDGQP